MLLATFLTGTVIVLDYILEVWVTSKKLTLKWIILHRGLLLLVIRLHADASSFVLLL